MFVVNGAIVGTWVALIPAIQESLDATSAELGIALFFGPLGALIAQQIAGQLLVRVSSRVLLIASALVFPWLALAPVLAPSLPMLAVALFFFGYLNTTMDVTMNAHGVALENSGGKSILSGLHAGWSIGGLIGAVGVAAAVGLGIDQVTEVFVAAAALWIVALVATRFLGTGSVRTAGATGIHLPTRAILPIALLVVLLAFVEGGLTDWGGVYLRQGVGADEQTAALAYAAFSLGLFLGRIGGDWAKDRIGSVRLISWGMLLAAVAMAAFLVIGEAWVGLLGMVVAGLGIANTIPQLFGAAGRIPPPGPSLSAVFTFLTLAFMAGPLIIGRTADAAGIGIALGLLVVASLLVALIVPRIPSAETNPRFRAERAGLRQEGEAISGSASEG
jgi:MFS family permease